MEFDYPNLIGELGAEERIRFYEILANNLTVSVRGIWSDDNLSDAQKVEGMKAENEIMHGVVQKSAALRLRRHAYSEATAWESIEHWVSLNPHITEYVGWAIRSSYESCRR